MKPTMPESQQSETRARCPECGAPLNPGAFRGLCARCLVSQTFAHRQSGMKEPDVLPEVEEVAESFTDFEVRELIGRGGMGAVYAAWQHSLERLVALKILSPTLLGSEDFVERFQREARVMGQLDHPNIAKVFDSGLTKQSEPFIVMELIRGEPITQFAARQTLSAGQRLELFRAACAGVQHAHLSGIVHRDIKPSNVLVAEQHGAWTPKVIDFGLAKSHERAGERQAEKEDYLLGTPGYTSPEQADGSLVDTRSDIYSLGALLYELLTGSGPPGGDEGKSGQPRRSDSPESMPGDLGAIVAKALAHHPDDRYQTVAALVDDLNRLENHEPVTAVEQKVLYRLRKFARRRRVLVSSAGVFLVLVVVAAGLILRESWLTRRAERLAADRLKQGEDLIDFMLGDLYAKLDNVGRLDVLEGTLERVERFYDARPNKPLSPAGLSHRAHGKRLLGMVRNSQGQTGMARSNYVQSIQLYGTAIETEPRNPKWLEELSQSWNSLAVSHHSAEEYADAERAYQRALEFNGRALALEPDSANWMDTRASLLHNLASLQEASNRLEDAERNFGGALALWDRLLAKEPGNPSFLDHSAYVHQNLAFLHGRRGRPDLAARANGEALRVREELAEREPNKVQWRELLADIRQNLSAVCLNEGRLAEAEALVNLYLPVREELVRRDPANVHWQEALAEAYRNRATLHAGRGEKEAAVAAHRRAWEISEQLSRQPDAPPVWRRNWLKGLEEVDGVLAQLAAEGKKEGKTREALTWFRTLFEARAKRAAENPGDQKMRDEVARACGEIAALLQDLEEPDQAEVYTQLSRFLRKTEPRAPVGAAIQALDRRKLELPSALVEELRRQDF